MNTISQFADDTSLSILYDQETLDNVVETLEYIKKQMGMMTNYEKTTVYHISAMRKSNAKLYSRKKLFWLDGPINILGVWVGCKEDNLLNINYQDLLDEIEGICKIWKMRNLTLMGKVLIVNSFVASKYIYKMSVLGQLENDYIPKFQQIIHNFIWQGKRAKIKLEILQANKDEAGLALVNLSDKDKSLKIQWVYLCLYDPFMAEMAFYNLDPVIKEHIWQCNMYPDDVYLIFPKGNFWTEVLYSWACCNSRTPQNKGNMKESNYLVQQIDLEKGRDLYILHLAWQVSTCKIDDILNSDDSFLSYPQLSEKFGPVMSFLDYYGVLESIPTLWQRML